MDGWVELGSSLVFFRCLGIFVVVVAWFEFLKVFQVVEMDTFVQCGFSLFGKMD